MEAAQWTLTSQQLQHIVSTAIRNSADASMIRILPLDTLERDLPEELARVTAPPRTGQPVANGVAPRTNGKGKARQVEDMTLELR